MSGRNKITQMQSKKMKFKLTLTILLLVNFTSFAGTYYVNINATGTNNGLTWANAFNNLQSALSIAFFGDEIWVASGSYKASDVNDRSISFVMKNGVHVYGGFAGTEAYINQRNIPANPTTLSGDIGAPGDNSDNSKNIIKIENINSPLIIDGFRIVSGYDETSSGEGSGAYINNNTGSIDFLNCTFYNNYTYYKGGAVFIRYSNVLFDNCKFVYNSNYNYGGGAIYSANVSNSSIQITGSVFSGNNSRSGGAIIFDGDLLRIDRTLITNNTATSGSIIQVSDADVFTISNSLIAGNLIESNNSASVISSYSIAQNSSNLINVTLCHNRNNSSTTPSDEAIHKSNSPYNIYNCIIYGNTKSDVNAQINSGNNVVNSIVEDGYSAGVNILNTDPIFINPAPLSSAPIDVSSFDYSLQFNSPGINAGDNSLVSAFGFDYLNNTRIQQGTVDLGAIESPFAVSTNDINFKWNSVFIFDNNSNKIRFKNYEKLNAANIKIYNINGEVVLNRKITGNEILLDYSRGIYIIEIENQKPEKIVLINNHY